VKTIYDRLEKFHELVSGDDGVTARDVPGLVSALDASPWEMFCFSGRLRERRFGKSVDACSIINAKSGNCSEDCAFCAQSVHHSTDVRTYSLLPEREIVEAAGRAYDNGVRRFCIVTSGRGIDNETDLKTIARCIEKIRDIGIMPCATLGTLDNGQLGTLRDAGLNRYHHNIETSKSYFGKICTTHSYEERVETLSIAKECGLSLCSGGILGMGETMEDRAHMALALREIGVDSVPLNFLMPMPGTPLEGANFMTPLDALKSIALFRFILPDTELRICGGRTGALRDLHPMIFQAGANGVLMGDYLTTAGRDYKQDQMMLADLGLKISYE